MQSAKRQAGIVGGLAVLGLLVAVPASASADETPIQTLTHQRVLSDDGSAEGGVPVQQVQWGYYGGYGYPAYGWGGYGYGWRGAGWGYPGYGYGWRGGYYGYPRYGWGGYGVRRGFGGYGFRGGFGGFGGYGFRGGFGGFGRPFVGMRIGRRAFVGIGGGGFWW